MLVHFLGLTRINIHITIAIVSMRGFNCDFLMPAVHPANGIRMNREGQVLMDATLAPENTGRVGVVALERTNAFQLTHTPGTILLFPQLYQGRRPAICACTCLQSPASKVVRTGNHAWTDTICDPGAIDVV